MSKITVSTKAFKDEIYQSVELQSDYSFPRQNWATIANEVVRLKEDGVRDALIKLGWTPPKEETV